MSDSILSLDFPAADIARLTFNDTSKGANVLSRGVLADLARRLDELENRRDLVGLILISGKSGSFIAGADLREFAASLEAPKNEIVEMCLQGRRLFQRLSLLPFVTVAAIDGLCLGGGGELAAWCDRRLFSTNTKTQYGFPEVKIGLFPGWGGTVRMPRLVGLGNAVEMITSGESVDAAAAVAMGLAVDAVPAERLADAAIALVREEANSHAYLRDRARWNQPLAMNQTELEFLGATAFGLIQQQTHGQYPAPVAALEILLSSVGLPMEEAAQAEADGMAELFGGEVNAALINVFFLTDRNKKDAGVDQLPADPLKKIERAAVVGAGIMGRGIAVANIKRQVPVTISDAAPTALSEGVRAIVEEAAYDKQLKGPSAEKAIRFAPLVIPTLADDVVAKNDVIVEAIIEKLEVKKDLYARLEPLLADDAILSSNTSTIPIAKLAAALKRPERFCGIHFFNPVRKMQLVEVIRGPKTNDVTVASAVAYAKSLGKSPIVVNDGPGFLVNRLLFPYLNESLELLSDGASVQDIDRASKEFGMPLGPLALYDMVGLDTSFYAGRVMWEAFPDRTGFSPILPAMLKSGRLGQKSGAGFFKYRDKSGKGDLDPALATLLADYLGKPRKFESDELTHRLFLPMVLEATRVLSAGLVRDVRDIDLGMIFGLGFPAFRGGLLFWADKLGAAKIIELLEPLQKLGERMKPTPLLQEMARNGTKFYSLKNVARK